MSAAVAQSVEQRIRNAKVTSSIPVSGTTSGKKGAFGRLFYCIYEESDSAEHHESSTSFKTLGVTQIRCHP